jgi:hypothetical protein
MAANQLEAFVSALRRMGGMYGGAWIGGVLQTDVLEVTAGIEIGREEVILVGRNATGYKPGRSTREGTVRTQKIDTRWELFVYNQLTERRDQTSTAPRTFSMKLTIQDPDAYGREAWQLDGCQLWRMQLGSSQADGAMEREYPMTWEVEMPLQAFRVDPGGVVTPVHSL